MTIRLQLRIDSDSTSIWAESSFHLSTDALRNRKPELCPGLSVCICRQLTHQFCIKSMFKNVNVIIKNMIYGKPNRSSRGEHDRAEGDGHYTFSLA
ncbi:hypothetical protein Taro_045003 [Colocasia esculenta]|uniref:Uncharacterized protein n=1 Tax=Colocasia esculenta TaxID=4460 RepID=A0A843WZD0_COLES|nr:hypothetical protein [Colocasia esculenta]